MLASRSPRPAGCLAVPARGERRDEQGTGSQGEAASERGAERSPARGPRGAALATANANEKGGWGQRRSLRERGAGGE
eukprot:3534122-Pleurochrysis_carterae.AAC.1